MTSVAARRPFQALLDEHRSSVYAFLRAMVGSDDADDCFQETFMAALRAYDGLDAENDNPRGWLLTIARNKAIDNFRARRRRPTPIANLPEPAVGAPDGGDPDLGRRVGGLPEKQRAAIALRYVSDLRYREIGEAMSTSEEAARRSVHEGLKRLREEFEQENEERR